MTQSDKKEEKEKEKETLKATPVSEKEKKLSGKVADKLKFYGVVAVLSCFVPDSSGLSSNRTHPKQWKGRQASTQRYPTLSHLRRWPTNRRLTNWKR